MINNRVNFYTAKQVLMLRKLRNISKILFIMETKSIKGTRTEQNLLASFAGESQARSRYTLFAEKALEEGYQQIASVFMETAEQELSHARQFFALLEGGTVTITAGYPAGVVGDTRQNLAEAAAGEREEWSDL